MTDIAQELRNSTRKLPNGHAILGAGYVLAGFGITRDSDPLSESNYAVAMRQLLAVAGIDAMAVGFLGRPWADDDPCDAPVAVAEFRHWACGWIHELMIRADHADLVAKSVELVGRVADYPVLDEDDYLAREPSELCEDCGASTAPGSGRFANRVSGLRADGSEYWYCANCMGDSE